MADQLDSQLSDGSVSEKERKVIIDDDQLKAAEVVSAEAAEAAEGAEAGPSKCARRVVLGKKNEMNSGEGGGGGRVKLSPDSKYTTSFRRTKSCNDAYLKGKKTEKEIKIGEVVPPIHSNPYNCAIAESYISVVRRILIAGRETVTNDILVGDSTVMTTSANKYADAGGHKEVFGFPKIPPHRGSLDLHLVKDTSSTSRSTSNMTNSGPLHIFPSYGGSLRHGWGRGCGEGLDIVGEEDADKVACLLQGEEDRGPSFKDGPIFDFSFLPDERQQLENILNNLSEEESKVMIDQLKERKAIIDQLEIHFKTYRERLFMQAAKENLLLEQILAGRNRKITSYKRF